MVFNSFLDEFENLVRNLLSRVEKCLLFVILPVKSEVEDSNSFPKIAQLGSSSIDYSSNFVCNNEFEVLHQNKVSFWVSLHDESPNLSRS